MKIIAVDNFGQESVADRIVAVNVNKIEGYIILEGLLKTCGSDKQTYYRLVEDDHFLCKGMEDSI